MKSQSLKGFSLVKILWKFHSNLALPYDTIVRERGCVNFNAAIIDVGSRSHYVAIGQELEDVREFGDLDFYSNCRSNSGL